MEERLTERAFWDNLYEENRIVDYLPNPRKYRGHYELDLIFKTLLQPDNSKKLLEIGAGGSIWLPYFAREFGYEVYGVDYSVKGCEIAKRNLVLTGVKGHILCNDFCEIKDEWNEFFDFVVSFGVVEHFGNPIDLIKLMQKLSKNDGIIITMVPNTISLMFQLQKIVDRVSYNAHNFFSLKELSNYHKEAGMVVMLERYLQFMDLFGNKFRPSFE